MFIIDVLCFYGTLGVCLSLAPYYKRIEDVQLRKNYGAGLGVLVAFFICGKKLIHSFIMVWGNIVIIKCCNRRYIHHASLLFTWLYLFYLYYNGQLSYYMICFYRILCLRLVGLAFELNGSLKRSPDMPGTSTTTNEVEELSAADIVIYSYFFLGIHKGPYFTWKVFNEHFKMPFSLMGDCTELTERKLKKAAFCAAGLILFRLKYTTAPYYDPNFYNYQGAEYRFLYNMPELICFVLREELIIYLCTGMCTQAGFGMYPAKCKSMPGFGPTQQHSLVKMASSSPELAFEQEYNFNMLESFDNEKLLFGPSLKDSMLAWNMSVRRWFTEFLYKNFFKTNKEIRSAWSFLLWAVWFGAGFPELLVAVTLWLHINLESEYTSLFNTSGSVRVSWNLGLSIMRVLCLIYLTPCAILSETSVVTRYYNSVYWAYHFLLLILIVAAMVIQKTKNGRNC